MNIHIYDFKKVKMRYHTLRVRYSLRITTTRQTGGLLGAISPCYWPASKGAGFHFGLWEVCFAPSHSSIQAILRL